MSSKATKLNRLAGSGSPYLQQHADNPVDWYEWGEEALSKAQRENKPLIISIGYAACHWCHVMAHQSFMDPEVARIMNKNFVSVKVDREERPDIDRIYMDAAQIISGTGGWPLNAFTLPDGKPFFAGTYYKKEQWIDILIKIKNLYEEKYPELETHASALTNGIRSDKFVPVFKANSSDFSKSNYRTLFSGWTGIIDFELGGFNRAPKFPLPVGWEFLLQYYYLTGEIKALEAVETTLNKMAMGGIYDQIGGGFSRYSVDKFWKVPHFEKMLYDNGQLVSLYSHAYQVTGKKEYSEIIRQTLSFIKRELTSEGGGFYSSLNADSEGEEGKFYTWTKEQVDAALNPETAKLVAEYYNISGEGNWEVKKNILFRNNSDKSIAEKHDISVTDLNEIIDNANNQLLLKRDRRVRPSTDDKILTSWNAVMLTGLTDAFKAVGEKKYLEIAIKNAQFLEKNMINDDGSIWRNYKNGKSTINGFLDDYAFISEAFINLYEVTFDIHWLKQSRKLVDYTLEHFFDENSGLFFYTSDNSEKLISQIHEIDDNVIPASNSVMATVLFKLGLLFDNREFIAKAHNMLRQVGDKIAGGGPYFAKWGILLGLVSHQPYEIAIMGDNADIKRMELQKCYLPSSIFLGGKSENLPLLENKLIKNASVIYVCKGEVCNLPVDNTTDALKLINN